jgi:indolepyruvate ferredoxin oxidoreductase beta subunit
MKTDIILAGVGGQGILSIAAVIGFAALKENLQVKQAEVHGMSQRGGAVQSHLRLSDEVIHSDLIPEGQADLIVSVEPMESLRYISYLSKSGWLIANSNPFVNIPDYPEINLIHTEISKITKHILVDTDGIAAQAGNKKASNIVLLGAASVHIPIKEESFIAGIQQLFSKKGQEITEMNINAFLAGKQFVQKD